MSSRQIRNRFPFSLVFFYEKIRHEPSVSFSFRLDSKLFGETNELQEIIDPVIENVMITNTGYLYI